MPVRVDADALERALRKELAANLRVYRNAAGLTLKVASERAGMHWRHWQKIEAGQVNIALSTLTRIARAVRVDEADLFGKSRSELN